MDAKTPNSRLAEFEADSMFTDRWSPRAFIPDPLTDREINTLFEAARWAPSCYNEQPWRFFYATSEAGRETFLSALWATNQAWAKNAPLLAFIAAKRRFEQNGKENRHAPFDAGAAWMSLALQARRLGLYSHAMAGFHEDKAHEILGLPPDEYVVIAALAVGRKDEPAILDDKLREMEAPNGRKPAATIALEMFSAR